MLYDTAARILDKALKQEGTIKGLVMQAPEAQDKKLLYALVCETLKYREVLEAILEAAGTLKAEKKKLRPTLALVLVYDLLFGKGVRNAGPYKALMLKHKSRLNAELARIKIRRKCKDNVDLIPDYIRNAVVLPRYVRVNTIQTTVDKVIEHFVKNKGLVVGTLDEIKGNVFPAKRIIRDAHLPELLLLPPNSDLHDDPLLLNGHIILQDKASCFPAFILRPPEGSICIDACAAPGNKTSHLSAIIGNTGTIYAFDKDRTRLDTLVRLTTRAGCTNIRAVFGSFLDASPTDPKYAKVEYILLDPSCSGSALSAAWTTFSKVNPNAEVDDQDASEDRVKALADFQKEAILHAFKFPRVKRLVYSTCSKHRIENEDVVQYVLERNSDFALAKNVFPSWHRRGLPGFDGGMLRVLMDAC
ncbi:S-adenosyl-L-methionine-dependent methyltransferase [Entophlyctis helioformis]|nr:S-adenosyl-L-methionine-dependent methyltransferase [Entophlyctis helioformis]